MRLFTAVEPDDETRSAIYRTIPALAGEGVRGDAALKENLHLTLKFLGETPADRIPALCGALHRAAARCGRFDVLTGPCGTFGGSRGHKTVWMGVERNEKLQALYRSLEDAFREEGYPQEGRPFTPHITLFRKAACDVNALRARETGRSRFPVETATLFESKRINGVLRYLPVDRAALR